MKTRTLTGTLALAGVLICLASSNPAWGQKGGKSGGGTIPLVGVFRDAGANFVVDNPDRISSDCQLGDTADPGCPYVNGEPGIDAELKAEIVLDVNSDGSLGTRGITVDFSDCVAGPCTPPFIERIVGDRTTDGGQFVKLTVKDAGTVGVGQTLSRNATMIIAQVIDPADGEKETWYVEFRDLSGDASHPCVDAGSGPLVVSHPDANTWVVEASTTNLACLHSTAHKPAGDGSRELHGTYRMPFRLTLTRKP